MKKLLLVAIGLAFILNANNVKGQLKVITNGNVGIGTTTPSFGLDVNNYVRVMRSHWTYGILFDGTGYWNSPNIKPYKNWYGSLGNSSSWWNTAYVDHVICNLFTNLSDISMKSNIRNIESPLKKLSEIRGVQYDFLPYYNNSLKPDAQAFLAERGKNQMGFIAQEFEVVFPELVNKIEDVDQLAVNYIGLIPVLVEAIKEQQKIIEALKVSVEALSDKGSSAKSQNNPFPKTGVNNFGEQLGCELFQNTPNPFNQNTTIRFSLTQEVKTAYLYIFNMQGTLVKSFPLNERGESIVSITAQELNPGMYIYTLTADGREVDSKRMILTK